MDRARHIEDNSDEEIFSSHLNIQPLSPHPPVELTEAFLLGDELLLDALSVANTDPLHDPFEHQVNEEVDQCFDSHDDEDDDVDHGIDMNASNHDDTIEIESAFAAKSSVPDTFTAYLRAISRFPTPTKEEQYHQSCLVQQGDNAAFQWMFNHNLRLVIGHARKSARLSQMDIMDLISHGNLGLWRAIEKFDPHLGYQFSTYATPWIRQALLRAVSQENTTIRVPYSVLNNSWKKNRLERLLSSTGRVMSDSEMQSELGVSKTDFENVAFFQNQRHLCYDAPESGSEEKSFADKLGTETCESDVFIEKKHMEDLVAMLLDSMPPKHLKVIRMRFGLNGLSAMTLDEVGAELGVTRERVRQIESEALRRMRIKANRLNIHTDDAV